MGFLDALGSIASGLASKAGESLQQMNAVKHEYEAKSDDECCRAFWRKQGMEKAAAWKVLKDRYGEDCAREMIQSHRC